MLSIQRPGTMGSTQPQDVSQPFGYTFDPPEDFLFSDPPEPPPGQPILSDTDQKRLSSFFDGITAQNYVEPAMDNQLNFSNDWMLPPQFMGSATSFGQQPSASLQSPVPSCLPGEFHDLLSPSSSMMAPPPPPPTATHSSLGPQQPSADVLAAATLLQNGSLSRPRSSNPARVFPTRDAGPSMGPPVGHLRHQPMADFREDGQRMSESSRAPPVQDNTFNGILFGVSNAQIPHRINPPVDVHWGSDSNFSSHFVPQSDKETSEALENERLVYMGCLEVNTSAASSRPSTPIRNGDLSPLNLKTRVPGQIKAEADIDAPPRKRRKSKAKDESLDADGESSAVAPKGVRKRKPKTDNMTSTSPVGKESSTRRRKSGAGGTAKPPRENLTEEQKRENHIKSEQKRRTLIKEGFDDLCNLVPGLRGGGLSKSTMLAMAAEALDEVLKGNEQLASQLAGLQGR